MSEATCDARATAVPAFGVNDLATGLQPVADGGFGAAFSDTVIMVLPVCGVFALFATPSGLIVGRLVGVAI